MDIHTRLKKDNGSMDTKSINTISNLAAGITIIRIHPQKNITTVGITITGSKSEITGLFFHLKRMKINKKFLRKVMRKAQGAKQIIRLTLCALLYALSDLNNLVVFDQNDWI